MRTVFVSRVSFEDAAQKAQSQGWRVVGYGRNKKGEFVAFAANDESRNNSSQTNSYLWQPNVQSNFRGKI